MNNSEKEDRCWTVEEIRPYIIRYLKKKFPNSIIMREFDRVDIMVLGENIPVEIQRSYYNKGKIRLSQFEDVTRRQIEQDIEIFGRCWFFLDENLIDYIRQNTNKHISISMDWLYRFFKSGKLCVFAISIGNDPRELDDKDFEFINRLSITCNRHRDDDKRVMERNKSIIAFYILKGKGFDTDFINAAYDLYEKNKGKYDSFLRWLRREGSSNKEKEFSDIIRGLGELNYINNVLNCTQGEDSDHKVLLDLGIIERIGGSHGGDKKVRIRFIDVYNIAQYFPGYIRNKELWKYLRDHPIDNRAFYAIITGQYPNFLKDRKRQKNIDDAWS